MAATGSTKAGLMAVAQVQKRLGFRKTIRVLEFLMGWAAAMAANDWEPISLADYERWANIRRAASFDRQRLYREAFDDMNPNDRMLAARAQFLATSTQEPPPEVVAHLVLGQPAV